MNVVLTATQRDEAVWSLRDIKGLLEYSQNKPGFSELDEVQTILASRGLQIAPIPKPAPLVLTPAPAPASAAPTTPSKLSQNDTYWIESSVIPKYEHAKMNNIAGFNWKNEVIGKLLVLLCKLSGITFKP